MSATRGLVWTVPNVISVMRLVLIPVFAVLMLQGQHAAALIVVALSSVSDWADGYIARRFNQVSELGKTLDPIADRCFIVVTLGVFVVKDMIPWGLFTVVLARDLVMVVLVALIARAGYPPLAVTIVGKAATLFLLFAFPLYIVSIMSIFPAGLTDAAGVAAWMFAIVGAVLYWVSAGQYLIAGRALLRSDTTTS
ncbi:CDP-alcohol phosphatidyltransferase family protein [Jonesia denitrificans]|uniref:CDP-alcohol phosphatidyltransferase n=1 Tax=Jonesia denitrificans (strain ATCC 14870 / DSM 20603 / BCRC 15368 / CIP 55.134 / JCM 11481 / NBRC 15587 / NCTC 10816 / Prevot 55134) TaxID=471856 RepID=C7R4A5_JONDD|nr:CDP-alcohol phosphatidyltransferase family protein [Jonesia denitrificans]ACV08962.1 CDP-alcohol phosphatidyltransferase [Jonesia denitrificans DSM 20603]ASE09735.1 CDP-alcohol phosphatidyltransferase family protein [Jonesia denitrificans]QXB44272.1 CDP-alcohol phosphatidyltransferase family protein [Jonesia denitrificans]SQH21043.1 CDP-diacylglycerol--glycerol-3-phosphate 3-phosphatidyltransferase [Jonesia denitrificans]